MQLNYPIFLAVTLMACTPTAPVDTPAPAEPPPRTDAPGPTVAPYPAEPLPPIPQSDAAGPSGQDSLTWIFDDHGRDGVPRLMYSARASDEMALNLQCRAPGTVTALIIRQVPGPKPDAWHFALISGDERMQLTGAIMSVEDDQIVVEAEVPAASPLLSAMAGSGLASIQDARRPEPTPMNAIDYDERKAIADFVSACRRP